jgi:hypothetical protein
VSSEEQAIRHAAALAVYVATTTTTKVVIISTSIKMCEALGSQIESNFEG